MKLLSFSEYVSMREGLLVPDRAPAVGQPRINPTPFTIDQCRKLRVNPIRPPNPVRPAAQVVHRDMIGTVPLDGSRLVTAASRCVSI